jgi:hypothetical protein
MYVLFDDGQVEKPQAAKRGDLDGRWAAYAANCTIIHYQEEVLFAA